MNACWRTWIALFPWALTVVQIASADDPSIARFIKQLGDDDFNQREAASNALTELGVSALHELRRAADSRGDLEISQRARGIMQMIAVDLAGHKPKVVLRASGVYADRVPELAFDGDQGTIWNSGGPAPGWIEADVGALRRIMTVAVLPDHSDKQTGETIHEIWVSRRPIENDRADATLVHTFKQPAIDSRELKIRLPSDTLARYVQIRTTHSPSWVAWREIELRAR
jgi:hypothetical protein